MKGDQIGNNPDYKMYLDDYPLLVRFRLMAPGSYKHCQNVAYIIEPISKDLGLNVDLMKVCAVYHDIGKINCPLYFSENQLNENLHDKLEPYVSCRYITGHLSDGVMILIHNNFPIEVITIISEHHGNTILKQFHQKDPGSSEDDYRYKARKPTSSEAGVLMLVDSIEAASRAGFMRRKNEENNIDFIRKAIEATIERFDEDHQLDNVIHGLIRRVKAIAIKELESIYHKRVAYDFERDEGSKN